MKKIVLTFGLLSGVVSAVLMTANMLFLDDIGFDRGLYVGYTVIVISFLFVYFGIRSYRDNVLGGRISFAKGFQAGILITLISCLFYVGAWLVTYPQFFPDFADKYAAYMVEDKRASGASQAEIDEHDQAGRRDEADARQPADQRRRHVHRTVPGRPAGHADLGGGSQETGGSVMAKVTGIGGVFFKSTTDHKKLVGVVPAEPGHCSSSHGAARSSSGPTTSPMIRA